MKIFDISYGYIKIIPHGFHELLEAFDARKYFIEICTIELGSDLLDYMKTCGVEYTTLVHEEHKCMDILISYIPNNYFEVVIDEIIRNDPEILFFHIMDNEIRQSKQITINNINDRIIQKECFNCLFGIIFDENILKITYTTAIYGKSFYKEKIREIVFNYF